MQGLDASYFDGMSDSEKARAWTFLENRFERSSDRIIGLVLLDPVRAVELFKQAVASPIADAAFAAVRRDAEGNRLLLLRQIIQLDPSPEYFNALLPFARSEFPAVRAAFAKAVPRDSRIPAAVLALKHMVLTETDFIPLSAASSKLMSIHGLRYKPDDPVYRSILQSLMSQDLEQKMAGIHQLQASE